MKCVLIGIIFCLLANSVYSQVVNIVDFGAIPNDSQDDQEAIQKAINECKVQGAETLVIPAGTYNIIDEEAIRLMNDIMDWKMGSNPQDVVYTPYFKYSMGLDFNGFKNLNVKADGATLLCSGWLEPVSLQYCENIIIEGLTIDYKTIPHSEGEVVGVSKKYIDVELSDVSWLNDKMLITRIMF